MFSQIIVNLIVPYLVRKRPVDKKNTVHFPVFYTIVGVLGTLLFSIILFVMYFFPNGTEATWVFIGFGLFWLLGIYIILFCILRITYNEEYFIYRSMFGRVTKVQYSDITKIKRYKNKDVFLYTKNRRYFVDYYAIGSDEFLEVVSRKALVIKPTTQESRKKRLKRLNNSVASKK